MTQRKKKTDQVTPPTPGDNEMSKDLTKYVTTRQAAELLGVETDHINHLLVAQKITGVKMGYSWLVFIPSIESYQKTKSKRGRPPSRTPQIQSENEKPR